MLIATDLDGTLLTPSGTISARTARAIAAAEQAGAPVVPVTARQLYGLDDLRGRLGRWALCSNGAVCWDLRAETVLFHLEMSAEVASAFVDELLAVEPRTRFASIQRDGGYFASQAGYPELCVFTDHHRDPAEMPRLSVAEVVAEPALKLVARHPDLSVDELARAAARLPCAGKVHITSSGAGMLEVSAAGVTKSAGLRMLAEHLGMTRADVMAFGDGDNDVEMLEWAGRSWAVANAVPAALEAAGNRAASNAEDGVAQVIESLLAEAGERVG